MENKEIDRRQHSRTGSYSQAQGGSYCYIVCPYCGATVKAFIWSLAGGGKKCECGALHGGWGYTIAPVHKPKKPK